MIIDYILIIVCDLSFLRASRLICCFAEAPPQAGRRTWITFSNQIEETNWRAFSAL